MKLTRRYALPLLILPSLAMITASYLWPVQTPTGITPGPAVTGSTETSTETIVLPGKVQQSISPRIVTTINPSPIAPIFQPPQSVQNYRGDIKEANNIITKNGRTYPIRTYKTLLSPNDPGASQWWNSPNGMPQIWDIPAGARQTKIAIIDTGFAIDHQEFSNRWATNPGEIAANGIDDDSNGFTDDTLSWDFANNDANVQAGETNPDGTGTTHGTMVAGIAAATGNNNVGIAGVNWHSTILPIQALDDDGYGDTFTVASAVYYAADRGVDVISISLGTSQSDPYMREAVQYAISKGAVVVAASGNDGCDCIVYPANYPEVIAVGASDPNGTKATFSSYGANLDIVAPGQNMATSSWAKSNGVSAYAPNVAGTSFATPFVGGMLGLARSYQPNATWAEITGAMFEQANRSNLTAAQPRSNEIGYGFTRANTMLDRLRAPRIEVQRYSFSPLMADSARSYQCQNSPGATPFYELSGTNQLRYTVSDLSRENGVSQGLVARNIGYVCMGLPTDKINVLRVINLATEIQNFYIKQ